MKKIFLYCLLFIPTISYGKNISQSYQKDTLCHPEEKVYASCVLTNKKIVSFCGDKSIHASPDSGYAQYRYGTTKKIEMFYPKKLIPPKNHIFYVDASMGSVTTSDVLIFNSGNYQYSFSNIGLISSLSVIKISNNYLKRKVVFLDMCDKRTTSIPTRPNRFEEKSNLDYSI
ncbi:hypothetical protein NFHSH190041_19090 [Shewanella sp. NFH-SH190041]|uniref:hypothetical protein n=1 Tax=Shewanella sp. NFH-SH190041 TaxID=2950245 RepID=UPI0021C28BF5|nr:hypothetical protein [Shewanella sp. NFH-SH190041]BDM64457.1 hypothetical protein NFHSH190041_19090 [Shewanella sp. NFH-SH190041]